MLIAKKNQLKKEYFFLASFVGFVELVGAEAGDAGLNAAGVEGNETEGYVK